MVKSKCLLAMGLLALVPCVSQAALLTYFNFNNNNPTYTSSGGVLSRWNENVTCPAAGTGGVAR